MRGGDIRAKHPFVKTKKRTDDMSNGTKNPSVTEAELADRTSAPRITLEQLEANILSVHYFSALDGVTYSQRGDSFVEGIPAPDLRPLGLLTFCVIVTRNGFTVVGQSACVSPENFRRDIVERIAFENAKREMWPLMGYGLQNQLHFAEAKPPYDANENAE